jgi:allantoin racemase
MARIFAMPVDVDFSEERRIEREAWLTKALGPGHSVTVGAPREGALFLESALDQALTARGLIDRAVEAQETGHDAIAVLCITDPSVDAMREAVDIPVVGSCQASAFTAAMVAGRFSIVTLNVGLFPVLDRAVAAAGVDPRAIVSYRSIDMPIAAMVADPPEVVRRLENEAREAVERDGARAIVLGCTEMGRDAAAQLAARIGVPVIDPNVATVQFARALAEIGYGHSRLAFPRGPYTIAARVAGSRLVGQAPR